MNLEAIPKKYRPVPFWSWNEKLDTEETTRQVRIMDKAGIGGFFMHARGGLQTEYLSEEWFENVTAAIDTGKACGMKPWAYDENGWPSGFGNGIVNGLGIEYQQKYLRMGESEADEHSLGKSGDHWFYYDVNPFYVDTLDKKVIEKFIEVAYQPYYERFGTELEGFFTDEPQISRNGIPWSFVFEDEYKERYQENLMEHLEELFLPVGEYKATRVKFWKMVTDLFSEAFMKQIYDRCREWGLKLTGHLVLEETLLSQMTSNGACMPHYEYMDIPGMDWLGRNIYDCLTPLQVSSVAKQLGKEQVLSETFALCGHNVSFAELKGIYEWQMVHGINLLCQHLEGYSIRGIRKRDYPPAMYSQQPWWCEYGRLVDALSLESMLLAKGKSHTEVLLLHPQTTAWTLFDNGENVGLEELNQQIISDIKKLEAKHICFDLGDETIMERHARVENGILAIGNQRYSTVLNTCAEILFDGTEELLKEFVNTGGRLIHTTDDLEENPVIDLPEISYTKCELEDFDFNSDQYDSGQHDSEQHNSGQHNFGKHDSGRHDSEHCAPILHYFVNTSPQRKTARMNVTGKALDIYTGKWVELNPVHEFEPWGSLMVLEDRTLASEESAQSRDMVRPEVTEEPVQSQKLIRPEGSFRISGPVLNTLTLDHCDYYFDGELQEKNGYVLNICERANQLERPVKIHQDYHVTVNHIPDRLEMACETPEKYRICVNGRGLEQKITGYFVDKSFQKIDITGYLIQGENTISFDIDFVQSEAFYENMRKAKLFESEKNKLSYDIEIESIYLLGDFSVKTPGEWEQLERNACRYSGSFAIEPPVREVQLNNLEKQGFPFFCGSMSVEGELMISGENPVLELDRKGIPIVKVEIAGKEEILLTDDRLPLSSFGVSGRQKVRFTLVNNLRNLLGPHHLKIGEAYAVGPGTFYKEACVWNPYPRKDWDDNYCFVETGI